MDQYVDIEGVFRNEYDLIKRYREMSLHPECDESIEDIVNEAIVSDLNDKDPVEIDLQNLNVSDNLKKVIRKEFKYIKDLLDFDSKITNCSVTGTSMGVFIIIKLSI